MLDVEQKKNKNYSKNNNAQFPYADLVKITVSGEPKIDEVREGSFIMHITWLDNLAEVIPSGEQVPFAI